MGHRTDTGEMQRGRNATLSAAVGWHGGAHVNLEFRYGTCDSLLAAHQGIGAPRIVINGTEVCEDGAKRPRTTRPVGRRYRKRDSLVGGASSHARTAVGVAKVY